MSQEHVVKSLSQKAASRLWWQRSLDHFLTGTLQGLIWGVVLLVGANLLAHVYQQYQASLIVAGVALTVLLLFAARGLLNVLMTDVTLLEGAKALDDSLGLKDGFSSALSFEEHGVGQLGQLALSDIRRKATGVRVGEALPGRWPREGGTFVLSLLAAGMLVMSLQGYEAKAANVGPRRSAEDIAREQELLRNIRKRLAKAADEIAKEAEAGKNKDGQKAAQALKQVAKEIKPEEESARRSALRKLADKHRELKKKRQGMSFEEALNQAIAFLVRSKYTRPIARPLQKMNVDGAMAATMKLSETLPEETLSKKEEDKLVTAAGRASKVLMPTKLKPLAEALGELAEAVRKKDKLGMKNALTKVAKKLAQIKKLKKSRKMLAKALNALEMAKLDLSKGRDGKKAPMKNMKIPKGARNRGDGKAKPLPILPGPMRQGGGQKGQQGGKPPPMYLGPCDFGCGFEGQCMKCPCRGKKICPKTKKACPCNYCAARAGKGGGKGKGQGQGQPGKGGKGAGGKKPGWGHDRKYVKPKKGGPKGIARKTHVKGLLGKKGESAIMAVKTANDGSRSSAAQKKIFQEYQKVEEESLYREKVPLSKRDLVRKYFEAIKPKDD